MENAIYNELLYREYSVDVGVVEIFEKNENGSSIRKNIEIDFVCNLGASRIYVQSAFSMPDMDKRNIELRPFRKLDDSFKKIVITKDLTPTYYDEQGFLTMNVLDFLLNPDSLKA